MNTRYRLKKDTPYHRKGTIFLRKQSNAYALNPLSYYFESEDDNDELNCYCYYEDKIRIDQDSWFEPLPTEETVDIVIGNINFEEPEIKPLDLTKHEELLNLLPDSIKPKSLTGLDEYTLAKKINELILTVNSLKKKG